jgi:hypothetical protein
MNTAWTYLSFSLVEEKFRGIRSASVLLILHGGIGVSITIGLNRARLRTALRLFVVARRSFLYKGAIWVSFPRASIPDLPYRRRCSIAFWVVLENYESFLPILPLSILAPCIFEKGLVRRHFLFSFFANCCLLCFALFTFSVLGLPV